MKDILIEYMKRFTDQNDEELEAIAKEVPIEQFKKGTVLLNQGEVPILCYFVLKGCVRQYAVDERGVETTYNFFTEEQSVTIFNANSDDKASRFSLACSEDCVLVVGNLETEQGFYQQYSYMETMMRKMVAFDMGVMHEAFTSFMASTPEERYLSLLEKRPGLIDRVPKHQLASYLGITPESLSRIKKRVGK